MKFVDFAGSSVVHSVGGWVGLAGAIILGGRIGKFNADGSANEIPGSSMPMAVLGHLYSGLAGSVLTAEAPLSETAVSQRL
jgi:Amt family ammonium transporter